MPQRYKKRGKKRSKKQKRENQSEKRRRKKWTFIVEQISTLQAMDDPMTEQVLIPEKLLLIETP